VYTDHSDPLSDHIFCSALSDTAVRHCGNLQSTTVAEFSPRKYRPARCFRDPFNRIL